MVHSSLNKMRLGKSLWLLGMLSVIGILASFVYAQGGGGPGNCNTCATVLPYRGDANNDCRIDLSDAVFILNRLFLGGSRFCDGSENNFFAANVNGDKELGNEKVDLSDAVYLLQHLFQGGKDPVSLGCFDADDDGFNARKAGCGPVDCDDGNDRVKPGAEEKCDLLDNNCDGKIDDVCAGEAVRLDTAAQKLYYKSRLDAARTSISGGDLPTLLKDGSLTDILGQFGYTQNIELGQRIIEYGTGGGDLRDLDLFIDAGRDLDSPLFAYTVDFSREADLNDLAIIGNYFTLLNNYYSFGRDSTPDRIELIEGFEYFFDKVDEIVTLFDTTGRSHEIVLNSISNQEADITFDGETKKIIQGSKYLFSNNLVMFIRLIDAPDFVGDNLLVRFIVMSRETSEQGRDFIILEPGLSIKKGINEDVIKGTKVMRLPDASPLTSGFSILFTGYDAESRTLEVGDSFKDPVFGRINLIFAGANPPLSGLDSQRDREEIRVDTDKNEFARVTFTPLTTVPPPGGPGAGFACGGGPDGVVTCSNTLNFTWDSDPSITKVVPVLAHQKLTPQGVGKVHITEGEEVRVIPPAFGGPFISDRFVVNHGDKGRILKIYRIREDPVSALLGVQDVLTTEIVDVDLKKEGDKYVQEKDLLFDGQLYSFSMSVEDDLIYSVRFTWGSGSAPSDVGDAVTVSPRIKTKEGGWVSIFSHVDLNALPRGKKIVLPGVEDITTYENGGDFPIVPIEGVTNLISVGNINYLIDHTGLIGIDINKDRKADCDFSAANGPAILIQEERKQNEGGNNENGDIICIPLSTSGVGPVEIAIGEPAVTNTWSGFQSWLSDSYKRSGITRYGSFIVENTKDNNQVIVSYPDNQMYLDILFLG